MKTKIIKIISILLWAISLSAQESPYSIFGDNTPTLGMRNSNKYVELSNFKCVVCFKDGSVGFIEFDFKAKIAKLKNSEGNELQQTNITPSDIARFTTPDPKADLYPSISPYVYCAGNPIRFTDPTGCEIRGISREDASKAVQDIRAIFPGEEFEQFRNLIVQTGKKQNGYSLAKISDDALLAAFSGISLNEDQQAMVDIVVNTINSNSKYYIEYVNSDGVLSISGTNAISSRLGFIDVQKTVEKYGGLPASVVETFGGGGITTPINNGTHSIVLTNPLLHPNGIPVTTGHEIFGHGRSLSLGYTSEMQQHINAIQTENLILRMMSNPFINNGINHGPRFEVPNPTSLPFFR